MCILVPIPLSLYLVPYLHNFSAVEHISAEFCIIFGADLHYNFIIRAGIAHFGWERELNSSRPANHAML